MRARTHISITRVLNPLNFLSEAMTVMKEHIPPQIGTEPPIFNEPVETRQRSVAGKYGQAAPPPKKHT